MRLQLSATHTSDSVSSARRSAVVHLCPQPPSHLRADGTHSRPTRLRRPVRSRTGHIIFALLLTLKWKAFEERYAGAPPHALSRLSPLLSPLDTHSDTQSHAAAITAAKNREHACYVARQAVSPVIEHRPHATAEGGAGERDSWDRGL